ncbi:MAG: patatin-like phospholipase family protein, partial [Candidatus Omnitrophica bacterium]|nr:patatin-like phospholipase family protein [Candidatus Omnitrophota bacterium]
ATPNIFDTIVQAIYTMEYELVRLRIKEADIVINPDTGRIGPLEFYKGQEAILEGYKAVMKEKRLNFLDTKAGR